MKKLLLILIIGFLFTGCNLRKTNITSEASTSIEASSDSASPNAAYIPSDPIETFLVELTKDVKIPFESPVKADIFWNEGDSPNSLKVFFGDSFLIKEISSTLEKEKLVSEYLVEKGFTAMKYNGSLGENSRKMGYRKGDLICKTDFSIYPEETSQHLVVYCSDATKGTLRK